MRCEKPRPIWDRRAHRAGVGDARVRSSSIHARKPFLERHLALDHAAAFTLIELLVVIAVVALLLAALLESPACFDEPAGVEPQQQASLGQHEVAEREETHE